MFDTCVRRSLDLVVQVDPQALERSTAREVAEYRIFHSIELNMRYPDRTGWLRINGALASSVDA